MQGELFYGNDGYRSNDGYVGHEPDLSTFSTQESGEIKEEEQHLDIFNSNSRLDRYLFYFSSKL